MCVRHSLILDLTETNQVAYFFIEKCIKVCVIYPPQYWTLLTFVDIKKIQFLGVFLCFFFLV